MTDFNPDKPEPTLGFLLHDVARLVRKLFEQRARGLGLTRAQWQVLAYLRFNDGIRQGALAEMLELEPISLSRVVDKLEAAGFLERRPDPTDRRSKQLFLLPAAHPKLIELKTIAAAVKDDALQGVPEADVARLMATLQSMRENLGGTGSTEPPANKEDSDG